MFILQFPGFPIIAINKLDETYQSLKLSAHESLPLYEIQLRWLFFLGIHPNL